MAEAVAWLNWLTVSVWRYLGIPASAQTTATLPTATESKSHLMVLARLLLSIVAK